MTSLNQPSKTDARWCKPPNEFGQLSWQNFLNPPKKFDPPPSSQPTGLTHNSIGGPCLSGASWCPPFPSMIPWPGGTLRHRSSDSRKRGFRFLPPSGRLTGLTFYSLGGPCLSLASWYARPGPSSARCNGADLGENGFGSFCRNKRTSPDGGETPNSLTSSSGDETPEYPEKMESRDNTYLRPLTARKISEFPGFPFNRYIAGSLLRFPNKCS
jgi:hypothetical protein